MAFLLPVHSCPYCKGLQEELQWRLSSRQCLFLFLFFLFVLSVSTGF